MVRPPWSIEHPPTKRHVKDGPLDCDVNGCGGIPLGDCLCAFVLGELFHGELEVGGGFDQAPDDGVLFEVLVFLDPPVEGLLFGVGEVGEAV